MKRPTQQPLALELSPRYGREDFMPAPCNADALSWISNWPDWPGPALALHGPAGSGKTHLLHAIGHAYLQAHPRARIFYCSAERFMVEFVQALKANQMIEFKARLRSFDLLLVDDQTMHLPNDIIGQILEKED